MYLKILLAQWDTIYFGIILNCVVLLRRCDFKVKFKAAMKNEVIIMN